MAKRLLRKLEIPKYEPLEERLWPSLFAIVLLTGLMMGTAAAYLRFDDLRWYANAWTFLMAIPLMTLMIAGWLVLVDRGQHRRVLQLATILGIVVHVILLIVCLESHFSRGYLDSDPSRQVAKKSGKRQPVVPPSFKPKTKPNPSKKRDWEKPVPTKTKIANAVPEVPRPETTKPQTPVDPQPVPVERPTPTVRPQQIARQQSQTSPSVSAVNRSRLSRNTKKKTEASSKPIQVVQRSKSNSPSSESLAASSTAARNATSQASSMRRAVQTPENTAAKMSQPTTKLSANRQNPKVSPKTTSAQRTQTQQLTQSPIQTNPSAAPTPKTQARPLQAEAVAVRQDQTGSPNTSQRPSPTPEPTPAKITPQVTRRELALENAPQIASAANVTQPRNTRSPTATATIEKTDTQRATAAKQSAATAQSLAARSENNSAEPQSAAADAVTPNLPTTSANANVIANAKVQNRANSHSDDPRVSSLAMSAPMRSSETAISGAALAMPIAANAGSQTGKTASTLDAAAVEHGTQGVAGAGASPNISRHAAAGSSPAQVASGSMPRNASMQEMPQGAALSPSSVARMPRRKADSSESGASLNHAPVEVAGVQSQMQSPQLSASTSASRQNAASDSPQGKTTAMRGADAADVGVPRYVAEQGAGRAAGGGQPNIQATAIAQANSRRGQGSGQLAPMTSTKVAMRASGNDVASGDRSGQRSIGPLESAQIATARSSGGQQASASNNSQQIKQMRAKANGQSGETGLASTSPAAARAEATGSDQPQVVSGKGTGNPSRSSSGPEFRLATKANVPGIASTSQASGTSQDSLVSNAPTSGQGRLASSEAVGEVSRGDLGESGGTSANVVRGSNNRQQRAEAGDSPSLAKLGGMSSGARTNGTEIGLTTRVEMPGSQTGRETGSANDSGSLQGLAVGTSRQGNAEATNVTVAVNAEVGSGGLGSISEPDVGILRPDSTVMPTTGVSGRFAQRNPGGIPDLNSSVVVGTKPFRQRMARNEPGSSEATRTPGEISIPTEKAIELGLLFLRRNQESDGRWKLERFDAVDSEVQLRSDTAATGLALLAFQGAGYHHHSKKYGDAISAAIQFLIQNQRDSGELYVPNGDSSDRFCRLYSHGIAAIAICEAYGMTQDPKLKEPAQKAIQYIVATQQSSRGGWRYDPGQSSDTSVTGWMVMALKSGQLAGIEVPPKVMKGVQKWLGLAQADESRSHLFRYNPFASEEQKHGRTPSAPMTAVGLLLRMYLGWDRSDVRLQHGADYMLETPPSLGFGSVTSRDTYYWYYATQVFYHLGGEYWEKWYRQLYPLLLDSQVQSGVLAGSWDPQRPVPDRWGSQAGRIYVTTMNLLSLEVRYRILPLYEDSAGIGR